jgi:hypothetical protein
VAPDQERPAAESSGPVDPATPSEATPSPASRIAWLWTPSGLTLLVILAFMGVGGYWRLEQLGSVSLWNDEAQSTIYSLSILQHGYPVIVSQHLINNWEPMYPYLEAVSIGFLGQSNFAFRLPSAILGIGLIPIAYWIGNRLRDRYLGITFAAMVAFSSEYIAWSRQARWYMLFVVLLAVGLLAVLIWSQAPVRRRTRQLCAVAVVGAVLGLALTSVGLFLLYLPGILVGSLAYLVALRWRALRRFLVGPGKTDQRTQGEPPPVILYRARLPLVLLLALGIAVVGLLEAQPISHFATSVFVRLVGFPPYPLVWSPDFGSYLLDLYLGVVVLAFGSIYFVARSRTPIEIGLLAFAGAAFVSVSVGGSVTNNIAGGIPAVPRHIVPLLFVLFLLASLSMEEIVRWTVTALARAWPRPRSLRKAAPALYGTAVVVMLVVPGIVVPSGNSLNTFKSETPANVFIPWVPFSVAPAYPWALYQTEQANYQLASDFVLDHRVPGDVIAASTTGPPAVYLGGVQYWIRGNAIPTTVYYVDGRPTFYQTGAVLVSNLSQVESLEYNSSGWFISDIRGTGGPAFPGQMYLVFRYFMTSVPNGSDPTIFLFHWNRSTPFDLLEELRNQYVPLYNYTRNFTEQELLDWAVTNGVRSFLYRDLLVPMTPYFLSVILNEGYRAFGTLFYLYNTQSTLQAEFPGVATPPYNDTRLVTWACGVSSGEISSVLYPFLAQYKNVYCK